eukprot:CAMPEP_0170521172 /NCGR_PEP_ID=MMETSP0209-20121228/6497_1 /TAXON_ID=665100 ORGANISM="Litonotus pictus, Strain P1" /NCGR_SAMPLE_ID=MMETSP0209 /ASSEMBLY_ACC=CAM_ASM_000301 /LENGTH=86 /DNA_ID=CAMNT_0010807877 /DNA_START=674 /DNA_END=931 /DNA_ORIENTATION=+
MTRVLELFPDAETTKISGLGHKSVYALENNSLYFAPSKGLGFWDICAGHALMKEAGGGCFYLSGEETVYPQDFLNTSLQEVVCICC